MVASPAVFETTVAPGGETEVRVNLSSREEGGASLRAASVAMSPPLALSPVVASSGGGVRRTGAVLRFGVEPGGLKPPPSAPSSERLGRAAAAFSGVASTLSSSSSSMHEVLAPEERGKRA